MTKRSTETYILALQVGKRSTTNDEVGSGALGGPTLSLVFIAPFLNNHVLDVEAVFYLAQSILNQCKL